MSGEREEDNQLRPPVDNNSQFSLRSTQTTAFEPVSTTAEPWSFTDPLPNHAGHGPSTGRATALDRNTFPRNLFLAESPENRVECVGHTETSQPSSVQPNNDNNHNFGLHPQERSQAASIVRSDVLITPAPTQLSPKFADNFLGAHEFHQLPSFVMPLPLDIDTEDISYLASRGVFELPQTDLRNALLRSFVEYVYPLMPIVDFHDLLHIVASDGSAGRISLLLLYAVMLAGSTHVDANYILRAGYRTRSAFRKRIAKKLRLLYDSDYEKDRLTTIQALVLMTSYHENPDESKHLWHWISVARQLALTIGLNRDLGQGKMEDQKRHLWKRVWWCCYIRDCTVAFGVRQRPSISGEECQWSKLEIGDFEISPVSSVAREVFGECHLLFDFALQTHLAEVCIAQLKLCDILTDIMNTRYTSAFPRYGHTLDTTVVLMPKPSHANPQGIYDCHQRLEGWFFSLREQFVYRCPPSPAFEANDKILMLSVCLINLLYHALYCALHRSVPSPPDQIDLAADSRSRYRARCGAGLILSIFEHSQARDIIRYMPPWAVSVLMQAALTYKTSGNDLQGQAGRRLQDCIEFLECLKDCHVHASFGISLLNEVVVRPRYLQLESNTSTAEVGEDSANGMNGAEAYVQGSNSGTSQNSDHRVFSHESQQAGAGTGVQYNACLEFGVQEDFPWFADFADQDFWPLNGCP